MGKRHISSLAADKPPVPAEGQLEYDPLGLEGGGSVDTEEAPAAAQVHRDDNDDNDDDHADDDDGNDDGHGQYPGRGQDDDDGASLPPVLQGVVARHMLAEGHDADGEEDEEGSMEEEEEDDEEGLGDGQVTGLPLDSSTASVHSATSLSGAAADAADDNDTADDEPEAASSSAHVRLHARSRSTAAVSMDQVLADTAPRRRGPNKSKASGGAAAGAGRQGGKRGAKKRTRTRRGKRKIPPDVAKLLGEANMCYVSQDFSEAIRLLEEVVRRVPSVADPYHTLGLVYEEMDNRRKALDCYLIAAYLTGRDAETWKRVATMSHQQGLHEQAIYCINRALRLVPGDGQAQFTRATVLVDMGQLKKGTEAFRNLQRLRPHDVRVNDQ
jgi:tetratricopeptide (TPR) repeat protein